MNIISELRALLHKYNKQDVFQIQRPFLEQLLNAAEDKSEISVHRLHQIRNFSASVSHEVLPQPNWPTSKEVEAMANELIRRRLYY